MRQVNTTLYNILSLINVADDYGFAKTILFQAFADILGELSDEEIEEYVQKLHSQKEYAIEDYFATRERLIDFKKHYINED